MITKEERGEIQARLEAARPAPWIVKDDNEDTEYLPFWVINNEPDESGDWFVELRVGDYPTAEFVAHAPEDMRKLLEALDAETKRADEAEREWKLYLEFFKRTTHEKALSEILAGRDKYKRRAEAFEKAVKNSPDPCWFCTIVYDCCGDCEFEFDDSAISKGGDGE